MSSFSKYINLLLIIKIKTLLLKIISFSGLMAISRKFNKLVKLKFNYLFCDGRESPYNARLKIKSAILLSMLVSQSLLSCLSKELYVAPAISLNRSSWLGKEVLLYFQIF